MTSITLYARTNARATSGEDVSCQTLLFSRSSSMMPPYYCRVGVVRNACGTLMVYGPRKAWKWRDGGVNCTTTSTYVSKKLLLGITLRCLEF
jgi:hypothetical protein